MGSPVSSSVPKLASAPVCSEPTQNLKHNGPANLVAELAVIHRLVRDIGTASYYKFRCPWVVRTRGFLSTTTLIKKW